MKLRSLLVPALLEPGDRLVDVLNRTLVRPGVLGVRLELSVDELERPIHRVDDVAAVLVAEPVSLRARGLAPWCPMCPSTQIDCPHDPAARDEARSRIGSAFLARFSLI